MASCKYISPYDEWRCPEEATTVHGFCIFHDPDLTKDVNTLKARFEARLLGPLLLGLFALAVRQRLKR